MKHKKVLFGSLFASALALGVIVPAAANKIEPLEPDNAEYGERLVVDYNEPDILPQPLAADTDVKAASVSIHYHNDDGKNAKRELWIWCSGAAGEAHTPEVSSDGKDMVVSFNYSGAYEAFYGKKSIFFIVKFRKGTEEGGGDGWQGQSLNIEVEYKDSFAPDANGHVEIWCIPGEGSDVETYPTEADTKADRFTSATFKDWKTISVKATAAPSYYKLYALTSNYMNHTISADLNDYLIAEGGSQSSSSFDISLKYTAKVNVQYMLEAVFPNYPQFTKKKYVALDTLYETTRFKTYYEYNGDDLGVTYNGAQSTTFKVWAPAAANVRVYLYSSGSNSTYEAEDPTATDNLSGGYNMAFRPGGVWELTIANKDLKGMYYKYYVANSLGFTETMDPYAKACGVNGDRAAIVDWNETNPDGWDSVPLKWDGVSGYDINNPNDLSIYETHIRDLTMDSTWQGQSMRGTYSAFSEKGTKYSKTGKTVTTGFDHIEEFGVKAIQLIPVFDNDNMEGVNERTYNWGYNPLNYNCVDGSYATDPYNAVSRIKEYKQLIKAYSENANHTRIIMDVVYNHVSSIAQHCFTKLMPKYYFRYQPNGVPWNGSGCGNEVKTEAPMMRKYIVDSLYWWAKEYKVKGFRFDLMGLVDFQTIKLAAKKLYTLDPDIYLYGEGWASFEGCHIDSSLYPDTWGADTHTVYSQLYKDGEMCYVGAFNNAARNAIAGETGNVGEWGFVLQGKGDVGGKSTEIADMLVGYHTGQGGNPNQMVAYSSCHDDYCTFDHVFYELNTIMGKESAVGNAAAATAAVECAIMMTNGVAFIQGGQEIFLSKKVSDADIAEYGYERTAKVSNYDNYYVSSNSYHLSDATNSIKWDRKISIGVTQTTAYYNAIKTACNERNKMAKYDKGYLDTHNPYGGDTGPQFNVRGHGYGKTVISLYNGGYTFIFAGNTGDNCVDGFMDYNYSAAQRKFCSNAAGKGYDEVSGGLNMWWYTCVLFKA